MSRELHLSELVGAPKQNGRMAFVKGVYGMVAKKHEESGNGGQYVVQFANVQNGTEFIVRPVVFREWAFRRQRLRGSPGSAYSWFRHALAIFCLLALFW